MAQKKQTNNAIQMTPEKAMRATELMIRNRLNFLIVGAPGTAKTSIIEQACANLGYECVVFHPVISDPTDFKGMPAIMKLEVPDEAEGSETRFLAQFVPFENLKRLLTANRPTVAFADDLGQAPPMVQAAWMQLVLARKLDDKIVSDNITFVSASNRKEDKAGVQGILEPLKSRFKSIIELVPDHHQWLNNWASRQGGLKPGTPIHPYVRAFVKARGEKHLYNFVPSSDMTNSVCPRTVHSVSDIMWARPDVDLRFALIAGAIGGDWATEFEAFIKIASSLPKISAIIKTPDKCPVPSNDNVSVQYAIIETMIDATTKKHLAPMLKYVSRFKPEFQQWYVSRLKELKPEVLTNAAYPKWAADHGIK
jgi:MoxR-like ATPase